MLDEQVDPLVIDERTVLDGPDAGPDGHLDALGAVRVGRDVYALARGFLDGGLDHRRVQFDEAGLRATGQDGARSRSA